MVATLRKQEVREKQRLKPSPGTVISDLETRDTESTQVTVYSRDESALGLSESQGVVLPAKAQCEYFHCRRHGREQGAPPPVVPRGTFSVKILWICLIWICSQSFSS